MLFDHFSQQDIDVHNSIENITISRADILSADKSPLISEYEVYYPKEGSKFLHEAAIIAFCGVLYAAWYSCPEKELEGTSEIRFSTSSDLGKTWTEPKTVIQDKKGKILYCPPIFYIENGKLYLLVNEMIKADFMHALDLFVFEPDKDNFIIIWSKQIPFKINTNVIKMENGKLLIPGRIANQDDFPITPAVLIAENGFIDSDYKLVKIQENGNFTENIQFIHPEISPIVIAETIYMFCRNDNSNLPILFVSNDYGESWSKPKCHNIPFSNSKIYAGTLSNNRNYVIGNIYPGRNKLMIFLSQPNKLYFDSCYILQNGYSESLGYGDKQWSYPCAYEFNENLYVIYSVDNREGRGAALSVIPINI